MHVERQMPPKHVAPETHGFAESQAWQSAAPVVGKQMRPALPDTPVHTVDMPDTGWHAAVPQPAQKPEPLQHERQNAMFGSASSMMQMPHASQMPASSQRSPGLPVGTHKPFVQP